MENQIKTIIVGAGPAGLAVAGRLRKAGEPFEILEATDKIAASWHGHYDRLHLHTVKELSNLPHLDFPDDYPTYVPRLELISYYEEYAKHFQIEPIFNSTVTKIEKGDEGSWRITVSSGKQYVANNVVIATGVNHTPNRPMWEGEESFKGEIIHSRTYKNPDAYTDKKVLVVGLGNTGAEIALDLAEAGVDVSVSVRGPVNIVPRDVMGSPVQLTARKLDKLPFGLGDVIGTVVRKMVIGDLSKYGIPTPNIHPSEQLRREGKTPVIDLGTVRLIKNGMIKVVGPITRFFQNEIEFQNGTKSQFDAVILATGYRPQLANYLPSVKSELDQHGVPRSPIAQQPENRGLLFIGYDNYKVGGILGTVRNDSKTIVDFITSNS